MIKKCAICGATENLQRHHTSYEPEIIQILCVDCHKKVHGHGVGKASGWSTLFEALKIDAELLFKEGATNKEVANACDISYATASHWRKKLGLGLLRYVKKLKIRKTRPKRNRGKVHYIRGSKETRMARLGIIEQADIVKFIDEALDEKLARDEKEREEKLREKYGLTGKEYSELEGETKQ